MFNLNVFAVMSLSRLAIKYFLKIGEGHIVNTSSLAGILPIPMSATYCATKHALHVNIFKIKYKFPFVECNNLQFYEIPCCCMCMILYFILLQGYFKPLFMDIHPDKHIDVTMVCPGPVQTAFLPESFTAKSGEVCVVKILVYKCLLNL